MGLKMDELGDINKVILQGPSREIVIEKPAVTSINMQGQRIYQIAGGTVVEKTLEKEIEIPEEDVLLVAQQAGVDMDKARSALIEAKGDLAKAILMSKTT